MLHRTGINARCAEFLFDFPSAGNGKNTKVGAAADGGTVEGSYSPFRSGGSQPASEEGWMRGGQALTHSQMMSGRYHPSCSARSDGEGEQEVQPTQICGSGANRISPSSAGGQGWPDPGGPFAAIISCVQVVVLALLCPRSLSICHDAVSWLGLE